MKINKIFSALFGGMLLCGAAACTDETEFTPVDPVDGNGVFLPADAPEKIDILTDGTSVSVDICRTNAKSEQTVNLQSTITDASGNDASSLFSVPDNVTFAADQLTTQLVIGIADFNQVVPEEKYVLSLRILGEDMSPYGLLEREYTISYEPWTEWELYAYSENEGEDPKTGYVTCTFTQFYSATAEMPLYVRKSEVNEHKKQFMIPDPRSLSENAADPDFDPVTECDFYYIIDFDDSPEYDLVVNDVTCTRVSLREINTGQNDQDGYRFMMSDMLTWLGDIVYTDASTAALIAYMEKENMGQSYYNPERGLFAINVILYPKDMPGYAYGDGYEYFQLPGFKDYSVTFSYTGNYVDTDGAERAIVQAYRSDDLTCYSVDCLSGSLSKAEIEAAANAIKQNTAAELIYDASTNLSFRLTSDGTYTIVAVGYDESGEAVSTSSFEFTYNSVQKDKEWESIGYCHYTDGLIYPLFELKDGSFLGGEEWDVEVEKSLKEEGLYRLVDPYATWPFNSTVDLSIDGVQYIYFNAARNDGVYMIDSPIGVNFSPIGMKGDLSIQSYVYNFMKNGDTLEDCIQYGWCGTNDNGVITFPATTIILCVAGNPYIWTNLNETALEALETQGDNFKPGPIYGDGYLTIDMSSCSKTPAKKSYAAKSSRSRSLSLSNINAYNQFRSILPKATVTKVSHDEMAKNRKMHYRIH